MLDLILHQCFLCMLLWESQQFPMLPYSQEKLHPQNHPLSGGSQSQSFKRSKVESGRNFVYGTQDDIIWDTGCNWINLPICQKYVKKVHHCFLLHCDADSDKFLMLYPHFKHTTFKCTCKEWRQTIKRAVRLNFNVMNEKNQLNTQEMVTQNYMK